MRTALLLGVSSLLLMTASVARAEEAAAAPPRQEGGAAPAARAEQAPKIDLRVEEQGPPVPRKYHVHDGFYLRVDLGVGALGTDYDLGSASADSHGGTLAFDVMIGGTPSRGLAIGGALMSEAGVSHSVEQRGRSLGDNTVALSLLGPFVDGFFDHKGGFHMGGMLGLAALDIEDLDGDDEGETLTGFGGAAWAGYDAWVADEWSIGGLVRAGGAITKKSADGGDITAQSFSLGLMLSVLYH